MREISEKRYQKLLRYEQVGKRWGELIKSFSNLHNIYDSTPQDVVSNTKLLTDIKENVHGSN